MRAPDPEKWKATETMVNGLGYDVPGDINVASVVSLCNAVARRRALEELRAIRDAYPEQTQALHDRIAEIEAEGE